MTHIEYLIQASCRALVDRVAAREALSLRIEGHRLAERYGRANPIVFQNRDEVAAVFDGSYDRQAGSKIIDGLGREAEATDLWNCRNHANVAGPQQLEIFIARD